MSHSNLKRLRYEEEENDNVSMNSSMDNTANGDVKDAKVAALEVEGKWHFGGKLLKSTNIL
jgi:hypothetical protein